MSILDKLYHEWYEMKNANHPETGEAQKRFQEVRGRAERALDADCAEELWNRIFAYMNEECRNEFHAGFRLGVLLMQELYSPAAPTSAAP